MSKVIFTINKELDFRNHLIGANVSKDAKGLTPDVVGYYQSLRDANDDQKKEIFVKKTLKFYSDEKNDIRQMLEKQAQEMWNIVEERFIQRIEKIHNKKFPFETISGILTTAPFGYGYDFNDTAPWFACSKDTPIKAIHTAMHEIMHAFFHVYFMEECKNNFQLNDGQIWMLKESLTVLLNIEFDDVRMNSDTGHPGHGELREKITELWLQHHDFGVVLKEASIYLKSI